MLYIISCKECQVEASQLPLIKDGFQMTGIELSFQILELRLIYECHGIEPDPSPENPNMLLEPNPSPEMKF